MTNIQIQELLLATTIPHRQMSNATMGTISISSRSLLSVDPKGLERDLNALINECHKNSSSRIGEAASVGFFSKKRKSTSDIFEKHTHRMERERIFFSRRLTYPSDVASKAAVWYLQPKRYTDAHQKSKQQQRSESAVLESYLYHEKEPFNQYHFDPDESRAVNAMPYRG